MLLLVFVLDAVNVHEDKDKLIHTTNSIDQSSQVKNINLTYQKILSHHVGVREWRGGRT